MIATIYVYSTDQLQGIGLSRAKRQSEQVRHALTTRAVSRLIVATRTHANVKQKENALRNAQLRTLGGRYLDSSRVYSSTDRSGRSEESTSSIAQWQDWTTALGRGCLFLYGCLFSYGCLYTGSLARRWSGCLYSWSAYFVWVPILSRVYGIRARAKTLNPWKSQFHKCHCIWDKYIVRINVCRNLC